MVSCSRGGVDGGRDLAAGQQAILHRIVRPRAVAAARIDGVRFEEAKDGRGGRAVVLVEHDVGVLDLARVGEADVSRARRWRRWWPGPGPPRDRVASLTGPRSASSTYNDAAPAGAMLATALL